MYSQMSLCCCCFDCFDCHLFQLCCLMLLMHRKCLPCRHFRLHWKMMLKAVLHGGSLCVGGGTSHHSSFCHIPQLKSHKKCGFIYNNMGHWTDPGLTLTSKRLRTPVGQKVAVQVVLPLEGLAANIAMVSSLLAVRQPMFRQGRRV